MLRNMMLLVVAVLCLMAKPILAEYYPEERLIKFDRQEVASGKGTLYGKFAFKRDMAAKDQAIKEIGWMTLQPGDSIGWHKHETNEDSYIIVSGEGLFKDNDGKEYSVKAGDVTIARKGESHALTNTGSEPLVFLDVIAEQ